MILKGLVAVCHSFCLFFVFITYSTDIHSITFIQSKLIRRHLPGPFSISSSLCKLSGKNPPCGAEPRVELGPALQQADALPTEPRRRFSHLHVDLVGPLPTSQEGYSHLLTVIDRSSRWIEAIPMLSTSAQACADAVIGGWVARFGIPDLITSDRGPQWQIGDHFGGPPQAAQGPCSPGAGGTAGTRPPEAVIGQILFRRYLPGYGSSGGLLWRVALLLYVYTCRSLNSNPRCNMLINPKTG